MKLRTGRQVHPDFQRECFVVYVTRIHDDWQMEASKDSGSLHVASGTQATVWLKRVHAWGMKPSFRNSRGNPNAHSSFPPNKAHSTSPNPFASGLLILGANCMLFLRARISRCRSLASSCSSIRPLIGKRSSPVCFGGQVCCTR